MQSVTWSWKSKTMANFVTRTRLVQYADLVNGVNTVLANPTVFKTGPVGTIYQTMDEAMAAVPANQRPISDDWWKYLLQWEIHYDAVPTINGVVADTGRLVFDVDFWDNATDRTNGLAPLRRNTFIHEFTSKQLAGSAAIIKAEVDQYLMKAEFIGFPTDHRDPNVVTTTDSAHDPLGLLSRSAITNLNNQPIDIASHWQIY